VRRPGDREPRDFLGELVEGLSDCGLDDLGVAQKLRNRS